MAEDIITNILRKVLDVVNVPGDPALYVKALQLRASPEHLKRVCVLLVVRCHS